MIEKGVIVRIRKSTAYVEIDKKPQCEGCKACIFNENDKTVIPVLTQQFECKEGDAVLVQMAQKSYVLAPLFLFGIPLMLFLLGLFIGKVIGGEIYMLVFGFLLCALGLFISVLVDRTIRTNKDYMPIIIEKLLLSGIEQQDNL